MSQQDANQFAAEMGQFLASEPKPQKTKRQPKQQQQQPGPLEELFGEAFKGL